MIIKISQTANNIKQTYDIESENFFYSGKTGNFCELQSITLSNEENELKGVFKFTNPVNHIPFRWLFGKATISQFFELYKNNTKCGQVFSSHHGFMKSCDIIELNSGETFYCYSRDIKSFNYISIYYGDRQIALLETYLNVVNYKYNHKLYLLDDYKQFADIFCWYVLYYSNYCFAERLQVSISASAQASWSFSRYNNKYDPKWRETRFPNENFFGKTSLIDKSYGDI